MSWVNDYVGRRYTPAHNCYFWAAHIQLHVFRRAVPLMQPDSVAAMLRQARRWQAVQQPVEGAVAFMSHADHPHHVGVVAAAGIVHALEDWGVVYESFSRLRQAGWRLLKFKVPK